MRVEVKTFWPSKIVGFRLILDAQLPTLWCWCVAICDQILKIRLLKPFWSSSGQVLNPLPYHPVTTALISWDIVNLRTGSVAASALPPCLCRRFPHANFEQNSSLLFIELSSSILVGLLGKTNSLSSWRCQWNPSPYPLTRAFWCIRVYAALMVPVWERRWKYPTYKYWLVAV